MIVERRDIKPKWKPSLPSVYKQGEEPKMPPPKINPISAAKAVFHDRLQVKPNNHGTMIRFLDGVPIDLHTLMRETNKRRKSWGLEQITHNEAWRYNGD